MRERLAALVAGLLVCAAGLAMADAQVMSVTVKETQVRATPSYMGKILGFLKYGAKVSVLEQAAAPKGWVKIAEIDGKLQGWVNVSSLTAKDIALKSGTGSASQTASSSDVALAGKGFNSDVEAKYKEEQKLDYTWVDRMESWQFTPQAVSTFLSKGGLTEPGGAQ